MAVALRQFGLKEVTYSLSKLVHDIQMGEIGLRPSKAKHGPSYGS
jgi:hypothetical protein